ncbi:hypothetical protein GUITHDRAFT_137559 [Guillardia theta CCMP2712]|uniref:Poly [ADP-ribose] polymerase n=1 Tax=Guillardia theta (strain CCMP2712) TaxID=905079 RepID=L1JFX1_GUITC|nr:hypothetical protein GUITHDRAFT_137559 [Guillardia theta CCMP2712]EKX47386.1 hypothetical protein GUITHDRAFT_137559 [Guillardia theta CCMP2712]|eukprot:XP_005834366.1 hypothetical protein GUITHDRAFT_137559 [Guillardia theta CCMP2712]
MASDTESEGERQERREEVEEEKREEEEEHGTSAKESEQEAADADGAADPTRDNDKDSQDDVEDEEPAFLKQVKKRIENAGKGSEDAPVNKARYGKRRVQLNDDTGSDSDVEVENPKTSDAPLNSDAVTDEKPRTPKRKGRLVQQADSDNSEDEQPSRNQKEGNEESEEYGRTGSTEEQGASSMHQGSDDDASEKNISENNDKKRSLEMLARAAKQRKEQSESRKTKRTKSLESPSSKGSSPPSKRSSPASKGASPAQKSAGKRKKDEKRKSRSKSKSKSKKKKASKEESFEDRAVQLLQQQLKKIISKAVIEKDTTLTKRTCRDKLMEIFGDEMVEEFKGYINEQVASIVMHCQSISAEEVEELHNSLEYVSAQDIEELKQGSNESESEQPASSSGNYFANNKAASTELQDLITLNGGKVQTAVTKKVTHLVFSQKKTREELDWEKEYRMRFNYSKEARKRQFNVKETIVPEVEAGGLMKGEKWHLVTQWGKVETEKPGCDVVDYNDKNDAIAAFEKRFWERTRNSWQSGSMSFRTHPGKFTLVDLSDDEDEEGNQSDVENDETYRSKLDPNIQNLLNRIVSKGSLEGELTSMKLDSEKMPLQRVKRHTVHEALAELSLIQDIIKKGSKQSGNDIRKLAKHSEKIRSIIPMNEAVELETFETVEALKDKGKMLENLEDISAVISLRKRVKLSPSSQEDLKKLDAFYEILETNIQELPTSSEDFSRVQKLFNLTRAPTETMNLNLERVFQIKRAGDDFRYKPFERLNNQRLLWRGGTASSITRSLAQGIQVPLQETPSANYPFGKGIYLFDCVNAAAERCFVSRDCTSGFLLLCEAALGEQKEMKNACALRRAPHGFHSIFARGRVSSNPFKTNDFPAVRGSNRTLQVRSVGLDEL